MRPPAEIEEPRGSRPEGGLPNLIVIGAVKCGTSALHYYLDLHPEIAMSSPKELNFFVDEADCPGDPFAPGARKRRRPVHRRNWRRGTEWYASHFRAEAPVRGESSPVYASPWYPRVAERMASVVPDARLIFMTRDPIDRMVSEYAHRRGSGREQRPLPHAFGGSPSPYLARSRYLTLLRPFLDQFPRSRIFIGRQEDLLRRRQETMRAIFRFLDVDQAFWSERMKRLRNRSAPSLWRRLGQRVGTERSLRLLYGLSPEAKWWIERALSRVGAAEERPRVPDELRCRLLAELEGEIAGLEELTSWDLRSWRAGPERAAPRRGRGGRFSARGTRPHRPAPAAVTPTARSTADTRSTARPRPLGGALPNLVLIGAQKCGTTSLHRYLDLHPEISMSRPKELNFFLHSPPFGNWPRGLEWYARHFDATAPVRGESSVNYTNLPRSARAAERMHGVIPGAKLIYMVRDPIERTVSHYLHARGLGYESRQITEALRDLDSEFVGRSRYHMQLAEFLRYYPPSSVLVAAQEDLLHRRAETLRRIFAFLGVEESFRSPKFERMWEVSRGKDRKYMLAYQASRRVGKRRWARLPTGLRWVVERVAYFPVWGGIRRPELEEPLRGELAACLQEDAERLRALTGQRFEEWSV